MQTDTLTDYVETRHVRKRDGTTLQAFDLEKVVNAIQGAFGDCTKEVPVEKVRRIAAEATGSWDAGAVLDVETIQDAVEVALMRHRFFDVAKAFILYRQKRAELRQTRRHPDPLAVSDYIHAAKYARYLPELRRREVYVETVARVEAMHLRRFDHIHGLGDRIRWAFDLVRQKRVLPSMRSMQFAGAAIERVNNRMFNCSATHIDRLEAIAEGFFLLLCGCGVGYSIQFEHVDRLPEFCLIDNRRVVHHIVEDSVEGWSRALRALLLSYVSGERIEFAYHLIRPEGAPLRTSGGLAPGHIPLRRAIERIRAVLDGAQGRRLRPIEAHRIMCHAADAVLSGGVRRSAMIALFSLEDSEMMYAKTGPWFERDPWFANANNSVVLCRDEVREAQFQRIFRYTREFGEPGFLFVSDRNQATNPCQPDNAPILTPAGIRAFGDTRVGDIIWSGLRWTKITKKVATGVKPVFRYQTTAGAFVGTANHQVLQAGVRVAAQDADAIDVVCGPLAKATPIDLQDVMDGWVFGDGSVHGASNDLVYLNVGEEDAEIHDEFRDFVLESRFKLSPFAWIVRTTLNAVELPRTYDRRIPDRFLYGSLSKARGFLRGLYSANGSICGGRVTLKASSFPVISAVQEMLSALGISSYYTTNKANDVVFANGVYTCRQNYDLNITRGRCAFRDLIGFVHSAKTVRLMEACTTRPSMRPEKTTYDVVSITPLGEMPVSDITVEADEHTYWTGGLLVSNCAEIALNPQLRIDYDVMRLLRERAKRGKVAPKVKLGDVYTGYAFCNLSEINAARLTSKEDFLEATEAAVLIGTLQAAYTDMPELGWVSEAIAEREALLGVSMTGILDSPQIACNPAYQREAAERAVDWNAEYAQRIGIRPAARITCVKPAGTTSLALGGVGSGHHAHHARRYIRRVTANELEPIFRFFRSVNPQMCVRKPNGDWVIEFPVEAPDGAILKEDLSAIAFLDVVLQTQLNWVLPGTARPESSPGYHHNVSNTVHVRPEEWDLVARYLWEHREHFTGVTLLPATGDKDYAFAPHEAIATEADEARWNQILASYRPVPYTDFVEEEDSTTHVAEPACAGGACEVP